MGPLLTPLLLVLSGAAVLYADSAVAAHSADAATASSSPQRVRAARTSAGVAEARGGFRLLGDPIPRGGHTVSHFRAISDKVLRQGGETFLLSRDSASGLPSGIDFATAADIVRSPPDDARRKRLGPYENVTALLRLVALEPHPSVADRAIATPALEATVIHRGPELARATVVVSDTNATAATGARSGREPRVVVLRSPRDPPLLTTGFRVESASALTLLRTSSSVRVEVIAEPVAVTPVVARVDLPPGVRSGKFDVQLRNTSFGVKFGLTVSTTPSGARQLSWTVTRAGVRSPDFAAAVYDARGSLVSSAVVRLPSTRGVTFDDVFQAKERHERPSTPGPRRLVAASVEDARRLANGSVSATIRAMTTTARPGAPPDLAPDAEALATLVAEARRPVRFHLAADFQELFREHFGTLRIADVRDGVIDPALSFDDDSGGALVFAIPLERRLVGIAGLAAALEAEDEGRPSPTVRFAAGSSAAAGGRALDVHVDLGVAARDVQLSIHDGAGGVLFTACDDAEWHTTAASSTRTWRAALQVPRDQWAGDAISIRLRFNEEAAGASTPPQETAAKSQTGGAVDGDHADEPTSPTLRLIKAVGGAVERVTLDDDDGHGSNVSGMYSPLLRSAVNTPAGAVVFVQPAQACITMADVVAHERRLGGLLRSPEWRAVLRERRLPAEPHTSALGLVLGLLLGVAPGTSDGAPDLPTRRNEFYALYNASVAQLRDRLPTLWPPADTGRLFGRTGGVATAVGRELDDTLEWWAAQRRFVLQHAPSLQLVDNAATFDEAAAFVAAHLRVFKLPDGRGASFAGLWLPATRLLHSDAAPTAGERQVTPEAAGATGARRYPLGALALIAKEPMSPGDELSIDATGDGALTAPEAFVRLGVVTAREDSAVVNVKGAIARADREGAAAIIAARGGDAAAVLREVREAAERVDVLVRSLDTYAPVTSADGARCAACVEHRRAVAERLLRGELAALERVAAYAGQAADAAAKHSPSRDL